VKLSEQSEYTTTQQSLARGAESRKSLHSLAHTPPLSIMSVRVTAAAAATAALDELARAPEELRSGLFTPVTSQSCLQAWPPPCFLASLSYCLVIPPRSLTLRPRTFHAHQRAHPPAIRHIVCLLRVLPRPQLTTARHFSRGADRRTCNLLCPEHDGQSRHGRAHCDLRFDERARLG
jgi:hypothetical protein